MHAIEPGLGQEVCRCTAAVEEANDSFGLHQTDILLHPLAQAMLPTLLAVFSLGLNDNPDPTCIDFHRIGWDIISPQIEGAAARQIETGMMPVARENPVLRGATVQGETHVWAAIIHGVNLVLVIKYRQWPVAA